jgi:tRNA1(Val) A37 N6-methylase TrmN6
MLHGACCATRDWPENYAMRPEAAPAYTQDTLLDGRVALIQRAHGHRAGTDAVLLAAAMRPDPGSRIADFGAGSGAVGLMAAQRAGGASLYLVERDAELADLCRLNALANGLAPTTLPICADLLRGPVLDHASIDLIFTNPPFFERDEAPVSPDPARSDAHVMQRGRQGAWLAAAIRALRPRGRLALIQRADRLGICLSALEVGMGAITVIPVHPRADAPASRILVTAIKGARTPLRLRPPLILHRPEGGFTPQAEAIHRGLADLEEEG